jgi:hypothetical protein
MPPDRGRSSHLSSERLLDLLEDRLAAGPRRAAEEHLGLPCSRCRERLRILGALLERMRGDRLWEVPEAFHQRALDVFAGRAPEPRAPSVATWLALAFDSLVQPLPAATRRAVGEARRLRFVEASAALELECETESADQFLLRGRLEVDEPDLHRIEVTLGGERFETWADADGAFLFEGLPRGEVQIQVGGPSGWFRIPPFSA